MSSDNSLRLPLTQSKPGTKDLYKLSQISKALHEVAIPLLYESMVWEVSDWFQVEGRQKALNGGARKWAHFVKDVKFEAPFLDHLGYRCAHRGDSVPATKAQGDVRSFPLLTTLFDQVENTVRMDIWKQVRRVLSRMKGSMQSFRYVPMFTVSAVDLMLMAAATWELASPMICSDKEATLSRSSPSCRVSPSSQTHRACTSSSLSVWTSRHSIALHSRSSALFRGSRPAAPCIGQRS